MYTLNVLGGRWKWLIIFKINKTPQIRYNELKRQLPSISHKMLSQYLKNLQSENLLIRDEYPEIPPRVEYNLTEKGKSIIPILELMSKWGKDHYNEDTNEWCYDRLLQN
ncbi:helix-turn-helix domain-containing protein [uncultured Clostridium sp.]|uniref:winged helix-turn-helix transcriptional regulator n=1 Tax=uncultured Clostridium sp. TaxID=59620 RepID=UPI00260F58FA|nr:helix-turn-helix domain-containing protein [uncultured Clostridium sp.]